MKTVSIVGARPQFVKASVVTAALQAQGVTDVLVHTGQHYDDDMSGVFFRELNIPAPQYSLGVGSGSHGQQTGRMLERIEETLLAEQPDWVIVYGDTNSTLAGALAAVKLHMRTCHVEAGLRSYNKRMPEEINRVVADHTCDLLLAPTTTARANLLREGIPEARIEVVGDVMYDAALAALARLPDRPPHLAGDYVVATIHRAENVQSRERLANISRALAMLAQDIRVVMPLHPGTRKALTQFGLLAELERAVQVEEPFGYLDMLQAQRHARLVVTDSGGVQKEAFFCRVPCVTVREETEWVELVEAGWNRLAPPDSADNIVRGIRNALRDTPSVAPDLYGAGQAGPRIASLLVNPDRYDPEIRSFRHIIQA